MSDDEDNTCPNCWDSLPAVLFWIILIAFIFLLVMYFRQQKNVKDLFRILKKNPKWKGKISIH